MFPGVQGKGEGRVNLEGEAERLALAGQCLAESQALGCQGGLFPTYSGSSHFHFSSELRKVIHEFHNGHVAAFTFTYRGLNFHIVGSNCSPPSQSYQVHIKDQLVPSQRLLMVCVFFFFDVLQFKNMMDNISIIIAFLGAFP